MEEGHKHQQHLLSHAPSLDLQLRITPNYVHKYETTSVEGLRSETADQLRLAASEKEYAERLRELTRREMELAQCEFARARRTWESAMEDLQRAHKLKERATAATSMDFTCHSCNHNFKP